MFVLPFEKQSTPTRILAALLLFSTASGCQSSGSKWAWWNPLSKSGEDVALAANTAPELPSDQATPMVEGVASLGGAGTAIAANAQPNTAAGDAPAYQTAASGVAATPEQEASQIASTPGLPKAPSYTALPEYKPTKQAMPPATAVASATPTTGDVPGAKPYDPNGYQPNEPVAVAASNAGNGSRYGAAADRYGASDTSAYDGLPPITATATPSAKPGTRYGGNRYASNSESPVIQPVTADLPESGSQPSATTPAIAAYPTTATPSTTQAPPKPDTVASTEALPAPPSSAEPITPVTVPETSTSAVASVYGAPPAEETAPQTNVAERQPARIATRPGEYRPGGTRTYMSPQAGSVIR